MNATILGALREARALYAASPSHVGGDAMLPRPGTHCVITALNAVAVDNDYWDAYVAIRRAADVPDGGVVDWNATHTTAEVLAAFDRAIATLEAEAVPA